MTVASPSPATALASTRPTIVASRAHCPGQATGALLPRAGQHGDAHGVGARDGAVSLKCRVVRIERFFLGDRPASGDLRGDRSASSAGRESNFVQVVPPH